MIIIGKASNNILKKINRNDKNWFFIDFSENEIPLNTTNGQYKIVEILDQFGNKLDFIPKGWQTICQIESKNSELEKLPIINNWDYNPNSIKIVF
jgi:hypothetical protein